MLTADILSSPEYDQFVDSTLEDPFPFYAELREAAPIHWSEQFDAWIITRYEDVVAAIKEKRFSSERGPAFFAQLPEDVQAEVKDLRDSLSTWFGWNDPPYQKRMRSLIGKAFTPGLVDGLRPRLEQITDEMLSEIEEQDEIDLIRDFAYILPVKVIAELLGVPEKYHPIFKSSADHIVAFFAKSRALEEFARKGQDAVAAMNEFLEIVVEEKRSNPEDDMISLMIQAEVDGDKLTKEEIIANCEFFLTAGHTTTTDLIGNGTRAFIENPDQADRLRDDPSLVRTAVEEVLRYYSPVQRSWRVAKEDVSFRGIEVKKGQLVYPLIGSANRDPEQFEDPDKFDIGRQNNSHLAFGFGAHFCLGAPVARLEGEIVFRELLSRYPSMSIAPPGPTRRESLAIYSMESFPVRLQ